jgi:hypothetical protein
LKKRVILFTWVIPPGLGDLRTQLHAAEILREAFPQIDLQLVTLLHKEVNYSLNIGSHCVTFSGSTPEDIDSEPLPFSLLREADLIIQLPTYYPKTEQFLSMLHSWPSKRPIPKYVFLGEYGWTGQPNFANCMGLHPQEKGILIDTSLCFKRTLPRDGPRFNLAYTRTETGGYLYLYGLLRSLASDSRDIEIAFFDMKNMLENVPKLFSTPKWGIKEVHILYRNCFTKIPLAPEGKTVTLQHHDPLSHSQFLHFLSQTEDLFGCTGDCSISEAISSDCMYWIDPLPHKTAFVKHLLALAILRAPDAAEWIELMLPTPHLPSLEARGERIAILLADPHTREAVQRLSQLIRSEYCANRFLCSLVQAS